MAFLKAQRAASTIIADAERRAADLMARVPPIAGPAPRGPDIDGLTAEVDEIERLLTTNREQVQQLLRDWLADVRGEAPPAWAPAQVSKPAFGTLRALPVDDLVTPGVPAPSIHFEPPKSAPINRAPENRLNGLTVVGDLTGSGDESDAGVCHGEAETSEVLSAPPSERQLLSYPPPTTERVLEPAPAASSIAGLGVAPSPTESEDSPFKEESTADQIAMMAPPEPGTRVAPPESAPSVSESTSDHQLSARSGGPHVSATLLNIITAGIVVVVVIVALMLSNLL